MSSYRVPDPELPPQTAMLTGRAVVTEAYTVIPRTVLREIVTSVLPGWRNTRCWVLAAPVPGFSATFAQYYLDIEPDGGCDEPEPEPGVESFVFVLDGTVALTLGGEAHRLAPGGFAYLPPDEPWRLGNRDRDPVRLLWLRKVYEPLDGHRPAPLVGNERDRPVSAMPGSDAFWATPLIPTDDLSYDWHLNVVAFQPGAVIPFAETHIMEHGIYVLQGKGVYLLNRDWVEVEAGDFLWLRAFCPQACYAGGPEEFRYLLYKNVNRQVRLSPRTGA